MPPSIFNPPLIAMSNLSEDQAARAAALLVARETGYSHFDDGLVTLAEYVLHGQGGYLSMTEALRDDAVLEELRDGDGRVIRVIEPETESDLTEPRDLGDE